MTADWLTTLGTAAGSAWLSGVNLYATVLTLGVLQRFHLVKLPGGLDMLGEWWVIGLAAALYVNDPGRRTRPRLARDEGRNQIGREHQP